MDTPRTEYFMHIGESLKDRTLEFINSELHKIDIDCLFNDLLEKTEIDRVCLTVLIELLYYKELLLKKKENSELSLFLTMMRNYKVSYSTVCYLYIINRVEKHLYGRTESLDNLGMYS